VRTCSDTKGGLRAARGGQPADHQRPDSQAGAPEQDDERAESVAVGSVADCAHDRHDLFNRRWVGRVLLLLRGGRPRWYPGIFAGERRWPATSSSTDSMNPPLVGQLMMLLIESGRGYDGES